MFLRQEPPEDKKDSKKQKQKETKPKKQYGKQVTGSTEANESNDSPHEENYHVVGSNSGANGNTDNTNSNEKTRGDMNDKSSRFNDERCPGKLGGKDDTTDVEELQSFNINFSFWDVPQTKVKEIVKDYVLECMTKDTTIVFHLTNNQIVPPPSPFGTEEARPKTSHRIKEFFNVNTTRTGMTIYYTIKSSITVM